MAVIIRSYAEADSDAVIGLVRQLQVHETQFFDRMKPPEEIGPWYIRQLFAVIERDGGALLVAERDGAVVGFAAVLTGVTSRESRDEVLYSYGQVLDLAVTREARHQGIGTRLLEACEAAARQAGVKWLRIGALAGNDTAIAAYAKFGFDHLSVTMEKPLT
jgi:ribosomal protein S18 acetylase RimI-like enzyme